MMDKQKIADFFDEYAPGWDDDMVRNEEIISLILDHGGIKEGVHVLDVACGMAVQLLVIVAFILVESVCKFCGSVFTHRGTFFGGCNGKSVLIVVFKADFHFIGIDFKGYFFLAVIVLEGNFYCVFHFLSPFDLIFEINLCGRQKGRTP